MNCGANLILLIIEVPETNQCAISESTATSLTCFLEFVIQKKKKNIHLHSHPMMLVHQPERVAPASHFLSESEQRRRFKFLLIKMIDSIWETIRARKNEVERVKDIRTEISPSPCWHRKRLHPCHRGSGMRRGSRAGWRRGRVEGRWAGGSCLGAGRTGGRRHWSTGMEGERTFQWPDC